MFSKAGGTIKCGGLINTLKYRYYPKYKDNRSKRNWKKVKVKGSSSSQGKAVDKQVAASITGKAPRHPMAKALLDYWHSIGHELQAAQVPVELTDGWMKLTQADVITKDTKTGKLWVWEVKSGQPTGLFVQQGNFLGLLSDVKCTKLHIWHLQLHYTKLALLAAGVNIEEARVIQIKENRGEGLKIKVHEQPEWTKKIPRMCPAE